jgi:uncharacterized protein (TIGR02246 family)
VSNSTGSAREQLLDLLARYHIAGDRGRVEEVLALFTADAVLTVDGAEHSGRDAIRAVFATAAADPHPLRHHLTTVLVTETSPDSAELRSYFQVLGDRGLDHWGRYLDQARRVQGRWLFARRSVRIDGSTPGGWADRRGFPRHDAP